MTWLFPLKLPLKVRLVRRFHAAKNELRVQCGLTALGKLPARSALLVQLTDAQGRLVRKATQKIPADAEATAVTLRTDELTAGLYEIRAIVHDQATGKDVSESSTATWYLPKVAERVGA